MRRKDHSIPDQALIDKYSSEFVDRGIGGRLPLRRVSELTSASPVTIKAIAKELGIDIKQPVIRGHYGLTQTEAAKIAATLHHRREGIVQRRKIPKTKE